MALASANYIFNADIVSSDSKSDIVYIVNNKNIKYLFKSQNGLWKIIA